MRLLLTTAGSQINRTAITHVLQGNLSCRIIQARVFTGNASTAYVSSLRSRVF